MNRSVRKIRKPTTAGRAESHREDQRAAASILRWCFCGVRVGAGRHPRFFCSAPSGAWWTLCMNRRRRRTLPPALKGCSGRACLEDAPNIQGPNVFRIGKAHAPVLNNNNNSINKFESDSPAGPVQGHVPVPRLMVERIAAQKHQRDEERGPRLHLPSPPRRPRSSSAAAPSVSRHLASSLRRREWTPSTCLTCHECARPFPTF